MSGDSESRGFSESLVLDDSDKGVIVTGITDDTIAATSGLQEGDEIVAATIHLGHLNKNEVLNVLKVLEPYDKNMEVVTKKGKSGSAGLGSLGFGLKDPAEMLNLKKDLPLDASTEGPVVSLNGQSGKLNATQGLGGGVSGPILNGDLPGLNLSKSSVDGDVKFTMPSPRLTGPDITGDLDGKLSAPDFSVSTPQINTPSASLDIKKPEMQTGNLKYKTPKFSMPNFNLPQIKQPKPEMDVSGDVDLPSVSGNLETPDLSLSAPKLDLKSPDLDLNVPKVNMSCPDVNLETPTADIEAPSGKIKWPHLKWKGPKIKPHGNLNANLSAPDASLPTPQIDGDISTPDVDINLPKADIEGPDLDVKTPNLDIDAPSGKINWPHLKWKKPKLPGPKGDLDIDPNLNTPDIDLSVPKVEGGINGPDVDINLPKAELKGSGLDLHTPDIDMEAPSGKVNWPHLKWKKPKSPKAELDIDADLNTPNLNLSTPKIDGDISVPNPELNLSKADLKGPGVDVQAPDLDIDGPSGKINWPHLKWKKPKVNADMDFNSDLNTADVDLSAPKIDGEINTPKADIDVKALDADIEAPSGKIRFPTLKKPKFRLTGPKVKSSDVDLDAKVKVPDPSLSPEASLEGPDLDLNLPRADVDVKAPNVDVDPPTGKFKWPTLKKPKWSLSGPNMNGPDVDLDTNVITPDLNLTSPKIDGEINAPDANVNIPKPVLENPKIDINAPDVDVPSGKHKWFNLKKPKFGTVKGPKANIDAEVKVPDVDLNAPDVDLSATDVNLSAPKIEGGIKAPDVSVNIPNTDVKDSDVNLNVPTLDLDSPNGKLKLPKFKLPTFKGPNVKCPELDANLKAADIDTSTNVDLKVPGLSLSAPENGASFDAPDLDINLPKADLSVPDVDLQAPDADVSTGKFKLPKFKLPNFGLSGPSIDADADLKSSDQSLSAPTIKADLSTPNLNLDADLKSDIDHVVPKANVSLPDFKLSTPKVISPDFDLNLPQADVKGASLDLPKADLQAPDLNLKAPDLSLSSPKMDGNLSAPNIKLPDTELEAPDVTLKAANSKINMPKSDLKAPDLKSPNLDFDSHLGDFKLPHFSLPKLGLSSSEVEVPSVHPSVESEIGAPKINKANFSVPVVDLSVPKVEDIKGPAIEVKAPNADANLEKSKMPHFKFPKMNFSGTNSKAPEMDTKANLDVSPGVEIKAPSFEGEISSPHFSASAPEMKTSLNTPKLGITAEADSDVKDSPKSKLRWPFKWGLKSGSGTDEEGSGVDSENDVSNTEVEVPAFKFHRLPRNSIDGIGAIGDSLGLLKVDTEKKDYVVSKGIRLPVVNAALKEGEKIDIIERLKMAREKASSANVSPTEAKTDIDLKLTPLSTDVNASAEAEDSTLVRGGTFKIEKPESALGLVAPVISTSDENEKLSLGLSNMLCLNSEDSDVK